MERGESHVLPHQDTDDELTKFNKFMQEGTFADSPSSPRNITVTDFYS